MDSSQPEQGQRLGVIAISPQVILQHLLMLPEGYTLHKAYLNPRDSYLELVVEHESLPLTSELEALPHVLPIHRKVLREGPNYEPELVEVKVEQASKAQEA